MSTATVDIDLDGGVDRRTMNGDDHLNNNDMESVCH